MAHGWPGRLIDILYPPFCALCGAASDRTGICADCQDDLPESAGACGRCARPLALRAARLCGACQRRPPPFDLAFCPFRYEYPVSTLLCGLKYQGRTHLGRSLAILLARRISSRAIPVADGVLPVPLHRTRECERGFNQAREIAAVVARELDIRLLTKTAARVRPTLAQTGLSNVERRRNVRGAFEIVRDPGYKHIAIIDDVLTTGSTVGELAAVLHRSGVEQVSVWTIARAGLPGVL